MLDYIDARFVHGVLMTLAWVGFHFVGTFCGKRLKDEQALNRMLGESNNQSRLKVLFWTHGLLQAFGLAIGTAAFALSLVTFKIPYDLVPYMHGYLGIAVYAMAYIQGLLGFIRPSAVKKQENENSSLTKVYLRRIWEYLHSILGRVVLVLGLVNCFTGLALMTIFEEYFYLTSWSAICVGWMLIVIIADGILDKLRANQIISRREDTHFITTPAVGSVEMNPSSSL